MGTFVSDLDAVRVFAKNLLLERGELHCEPEFLVLSTSAAIFDTYRAETDFLDTLASHKTRGVEIENTTRWVVVSTRMIEIEKCARRAIRGSAKTVSRET